ncbi:hypothetical protein PAHAL_9G488300 [Panicum hallii]|uniref:polynucleotide adenylyltransferase n=1 Tax=Panicum hallii TaxID=206008 RepID=A0A2S3IR88_9POAL|nr:nuclear poly(A) polymerase 3-like [Panicum hallii]PAN49963.1 hypothetical protein PAHAL_9G488300 [Panicum hallii]
MALDLAVAGSAARKAEVQTLAPVLLMGPPPPPPIPPTPGMYLPGPPPPGVLLPRPIPAPLTREVIAHMDECRSRSLLKFISDVGIMPSLEDEQRRERVVRELGKIVMDWAKRVAYEQRKQHWITSAAVLTFGSYALGAYGPESDIDVLCVGPYIASLQHHFFVVLRHMLEGRPEVSELHSIEGAKVPLMRFKFNGILVDFPYVQLPVINAAEAIHAFDPRVLENVDGASWKCLSGVCVNRQIIQLVPNMKKFQYLLRCLKLWARKRGLHCHLLGFFAGIHLAILAAYVCRRHPNASINTLLSLFFEIFVHWPWPLPVSLLDPPALCRGTDGCSLMPIMLPCIPPEFCSSSMTQSTFSKIKEELRRGYALTKDTRTTDFDWSWLFAPFPYGARYKCFLRIFLSAPMAEELRDWVGWVKSRFRNLILKLESLGVYCDPDPLEQADHTINEPNVVFFWGLMYRRNIQICTSSLKEDFMKSVLNNIYGKEKCAHSDITMSIVGPPQLPKSVFDHSVYSEKLPPHMMGHQLMKQSYNAVS